MNVANRIASTLIVVGVWSIAGTPTRAADIQWNNAAGGNFNSGGNWLGGSAPGASDVAVFDLASAGYTVIFTGGNVETFRALVGTDVVTFDITSTYTLLSTGDTSVKVGDSNGQNGHLIVTNGTLAAQSVIAGVTGTGLLEITAGGDMTAELPSHIGSLAGSVGEIRVVGLGSQLSQADHLIVGASGSGTLRIENGGSVSTTWSDLAEFDGSQGTVLVSGTGSTWTLTDFLNIGLRDQGTLTVSAGGSVFVGTVGSIADYLGVGARDDIPPDPVGRGNGSVEITGAGSALTVNGNIAIGFLGDGVLTISDGGHLTSNNLATDFYSRLGVLPGAIGEATVTGTNSLWTVPNLGVLVGAEGQGTLTIEAGGHVDTLASTGVGGLIGSASGSQGDVTVTGVGSQWTMNTQIQVGQTGTGALLITNGGYVESKKALSPSTSSGIIGVFAGGDGHVTVQGSGSLWSQDGGCSAGFNSTGRLDVLSGGTVESVDGFVGRAAGADGMVTIDGVGSTWTVSDSLYIGGTAAGAGGIGELILTNSGAFSVQNLLKIWPQGTLTVNGGSVTVVAGSIQSDGTVRGGGTITETVTNANGTVAPGMSAGILTIDGDYTQASGAALEIEIGGTSPGTQYDRLVVTGAATLDGTLAISLANDFSPSAGTTFQVMGYASHSGTFASATWPGVAFATRYESNGVFVDVLATPPSTAPSPHDIAKNRYISFAPNNGSASVAFKVTMTASAYTGPTGDLGWVGTPNVNGVSRIVASPVTRVWPESVIHVGDCEIAPAATYEVRATGDGGGSFTAPFTVMTIPDPMGVGSWGDVVPVFTGPSSQPDALDIVAVLNVFLGVPGAVHFTRADLDPQIPNGAVNFTDVLHAVRAVVGLAYPFTASCSSCCALNMECDDTIFCNGGEKCESCVCVGGPVPCASGCNESNDTCGVTASNRPKLSLVPTGATGAFVISNNEITLTGSGQRVYLELEVSNWDSDHSAPPRLGAYQAMLNSASYAGANASPPNPGVNCAPSWVSCPSPDATGNTFCRSTFGVSNGPGCKAAANLPGCPFTNCCEPAFIDTTRADWAYFVTGSSTRAVRIMTPDYAWGATYPGNSPGPVDSGAVNYAGTLALDVPVGATGTYTISLKPGSLDTFLDDETGIELGGLLLSAARITIVPPPTIHVNAAATGLNNGTSWANAFTDLQDALAAAGPGSEIWVAKGTYRPATCPTPPCSFNSSSAERSATFQLKSGVAIYGGFAGGESIRELRDPEHNVTILSGDLNGDDTDVPCTVDSPDCDLFGSLCVGGFCIIEDNGAENSYHVVTGSGTDATTIIDGFTITAGNASDFGPATQGAGMLNDGGNPTIANCTFIANSAVFGGGMFNRNGSNPTVTNSTFALNSSLVYGGGMLNDNSSPMVTNCIFSGNSSDNGGGMTNYFSSDPTITNCTFSGNSADIGGGGMLNNVSSPAITNCTFSGNSAANFGGGMLNDDSNPLLTNSILWGNNDGGGMDASAQIHTDSGTPVVNYSIVQGGWTGAGGTGNSASDPLFVNPGADNLRLLSGSPAIDAGDNAAVLPGVTVDLAGNPRILGAGVDMGAYEYFSDCNNNGIPDVCELNCGVADGPCDIPGCGTGADCNINIVLDACEIANCAGDPACDDCNLNGKPDACDVPSSAGCPGGSCVSGCSSDLNQDCIPDECAVTTGTGATTNWNDGTNWALAGSYPDDTAGVADQHVTLEDSLVLNLSVTIDSLQIAGGVTLDVSGGDLIITGPPPLQTAGITPPPKLRLSLNGAVTMANSYDVTVPNDSVAVNDGGLYHSAGVTASALSAVDIAVYTGGEVTLEHNMTMASTGKVLLDGSGAEAICSPAAAASNVAGITPPPKLRLSDSVIASAASVSMVGAVDVIVDSTEPVLLGGDFDNRGVAPSLFDWTAGKLTLNGTMLQTFEVAGINLGQATEGFLTDQDTLSDFCQHTNYSMGTVEVASTANVTFANRFANTVAVGCAEALYVHNLIIQSGATVTIDNCKVYYEALTDNGVTLTLVGCGELLSTTRPPPPDGDPSSINKNRGLTMSVPGPNTAGPGALTALRVALVELQNPDPPNLPQSPPPDFSAYEFDQNCTDPAGCARWIGEPKEFLESQDSPSRGTFKAARLQCTPYYRDWTTAGLFHVVGAEITPSSKYDVQQFSQSCAGKEAVCTAVSAPLRINTARSGDVEAPFCPPSCDPLDATGGQPNVTDIAQLVNKIKNVAGAPVKAISQLQPNSPELNADITALDIVAVVDAVKKNAYAYSGPCPCPSTVTCGSIACSTPTPCLSAFGPEAVCVKTCSGGNNDGDPCINNTHCPGTPPGTCGAGFCRDRCGRCTP